MILSKTIKASIDKSIHRLILAGLATHDTILGCTDEDVKKIESGIGFPLPASYREFLSVCGNGAGEFLVGTDWTLPKLIHLQQAASHLLITCGIREPVLANCFVFAMHQGYQFLFFQCGAEDDPAVKLFIEGEKGPYEVFATFSHWLARCVDDEIASFSELHH